MEPQGRHLQEQPLQQQAAQLMGRSPLGPTAQPRQGLHHK
jgi:hypothetical protein